MNPIRKLAICAALVVSSSSFAADCRAIFDTGYSKEVEALIGKKFQLVDEDQIPDPSVIPFRIVVEDDVDADPEVLIYRVLLHGNVIIEEKHLSEDFKIDIDRTIKWLKNLPKCADLYRPHPANR